MVAFDGVPRPACFRAQFHDPCSFCRYGISSNTFATSSAAPDHTDVERCLALAEEVAGQEHHFAMAQFPFSCFEACLSFSCSFRNDLHAGR